MKIKGIHLFCILLIALILCPCLGGNLLEGNGNMGQPKTSSNPPPPPPPPSSSSQTSDINATTYTGAYGNSATAITGPQGNTAVISDDVTSDQIPEGDEDNYILKSEIVPPVCPACPTTTSCPSQEPPPPCPPCARCPEPAFECKKVPNYSTNDDS